MASIQEINYKQNNKNYSRYQMTLENSVIKAGDLNKSDELIFIGCEMGILKFRIVKATNKKEMTK